MVYDQIILPKIAHLKADSATLLPSSEVFSLKKRGLICKESLSKVTSQVYKGWLLFAFHEVSIKLPLQTQEVETSKQWLTFQTYLPLTKS